MTVRHFFHVYAHGTWVEPVTEHIAAMAEAGFRSPVTVGLVGLEEDCYRVRERITALLRRAGLPPVDGWVEAQVGYEQVTLAALHAWARGQGEYSAVLYAHSKGAYSENPFSGPWRRSMTRHVVGQWPRCANLVTSGYDAAGCHWLTPWRDHDPEVQHPVPAPFFGGNFWWARTGYLKRLPPPEHDFRHQAEEWVGQNEPRVFDLLPGWPSLKLCAPELEEAKE